MGIGATLFGSAPHGQKAGKYEVNLKSGAGYGLGNRMGGKVVGYDKLGQPLFDYSQTNQRVGMPEATKGYDFSTLDQAASGLRDVASKYQEYKPEKLNPYKFNFADPSVLNQYAANQYSLGAGDIRREGAGQLEKLRESIGVRRPGLLMKAGEKAGRSTAEQLAKLNMGLRGDVLGRQTDLTKAEQLAQADELARAAEFNTKATTSNLSDILNANKALADVGQSKIGAQSDITERERAYNDRALEYLLSLYQNIHGTRKGIKEGGSSGILGTLAGAAASGAGSYFGSKGNG